MFYKNLNINTLLQALIILLTSYIFGRLIEKNKDNKLGKRYLIIGIFIIIALLCYLKYTNLFITTINSISSLLNIKIKLNLVERNALIGISYYSLIMISYLVDIYWGKTESEKNIFKLALFMSYFPILTSGPFINYSEIKEDLYTHHKFDTKRISSGLIRILWGLFKILVISLRISTLVNTVYNNPNQFVGFFNILASLFFAIELYTNFSGSIDIIMGVSEIIGINLPENFASPFFSKSITELWRRWHITLGTWLKNYVFYPLQKSRAMQWINTKSRNILGKKRGKKVAMYLSMLIMWVLIGAWHNGAYTFIIGSGILQFIYIFLEDTLTPISKKINEKLGINTECFSYKLYQMIRTYCLFSLSMVFFRSATVKDAIIFIKNMFVFNEIYVIKEGIYNLGLDLLDLKLLFISILVLFIVDYIKTKGNIREKLFNQNLPFRWLIIFTLIFSIAIFGCYGIGFDPATFIYGQF